MAMIYTKKDQRVDKFTGTSVRIHPEPKSSFEG